MKKRLLAMLIAVCVAVVMMPLTSTAASGYAYPTTLSELESAIGNTNVQYIWVQHDMTISKDINLGNKCLQLTPDTSGWPYTYPTVTLKAGKKLTGKISINTDCKLIIEKGATYQTETTSRGHSNILGTIELNGGTIITPESSGSYYGWGLSVSGTVKNTSKDKGYIRVGASDSSMRWQGNAPQDLGTKIIVKVFKDDVEATTADVKAQANDTFGKGKYSYIGPLNLSYLNLYQDFTKPNYSKFQSKIEMWGGINPNAVTYQYTGKEIKPALTISGVPSSAYKVTYKNNKKVGKASMTITAKGSLYHGSFSTDAFFIVPKTPVISKLTAGKKSLTVKMSKTASATGAKQYQVYYQKVGSSKYQSKVLKKGTSLTIKGLTKGKKYKVIVVGITSVSQNVWQYQIVLSGQSKAKTVKVK